MVRVHLSEEKIMLERFVVVGGWRGSKSWWVDILKSILATIMLPALSSGSCGRST